MKIRNRASLALFIFIGVFGLIILAGGVIAGQAQLLSRPQPSPSPGPAVDPVLREFYDTLGGQAVLGQALTPLFDQDTRRCQYTEAALLCFSPYEPDLSHRFSLAPLGKQLGVQESAPVASAQMGSRDLGGGFVLYPDFAALYDRLYGALYAGRPLTQVRVDEANQRYEQFFENIGFYRRFDEPPGAAHLITYGSYLCGPDCSRNLNEYWEIVQGGLVAQPFELSVNRLGWLDLGKPLTQPRLAKDGSIEQVYDNAVLYAPQNALSQVRFRPLVTWLGTVKPEPLAARNPHAQLVFYEVEKGLGHNVPLFFDKFIANHGGRDLAGKPLSEMFVVKADQIFRQCFESYCLDYDATAPEQVRVRMVPLGAEYIRNTDPAQVLRQAFSPDTVRLQASAAFPQMSKGQVQAIKINVFRRVDGQPLYLVEARLEINIAGLPSQHYSIKPTDHSGSSSFTLPPLGELPAMSVVEYQVCLNLPGDQPICATDSFIYRGD